MSLKTEKLGSLFTREISRIILEEVKNPKIKFVTITGCKISNDLSIAKVYFTILDMEKKDEVLKSLDKAKSFIRGEISKRIEIRHTPELRFIFDESIEYGDKIDKLIDKIHRNDE